MSNADDPVRVMIDDATAKVLGAEPEVLTTRVPRPGRQGFGTGTGLNDPGMRVGAKPTRGCELSHRGSITPQTTGEFI